jgi:hypothetical protein
MTDEAEIARTKHCPMGRQFIHYEPTPTSANRWLDDGQAAMTPCLASDCMMWRLYSPDEGYCGLAGAHVRWTEI